jgi:hypothetical protein
MSEENKVSILYTIKGIQPYERLKEHVAILLVPVDKIDTRQDQVKSKPKNIILGGTGIGMGEVPPELMQFFEQMTGQRRGDPDRDRQIVLIEDEMTFQKMGWRYGDTINGIFEKVDEK